MTPFRASSPKTQKKQSATKTKPVTVFTKQQTKIKLHLNIYSAVRQRVAEGGYRRMQLAYHSIRRPLIPNHVTGIQTL